MNYVLVDQEKNISIVAENRNLQNMHNGKHYQKVVIGLIFDNNNNVLINKRLPGKYMEGYWEFPGGKINLQEDNISALSRELLEELGIIVSKARPIMNYYYQYEDYMVNLDIWIIKSFLGEPKSKEGQEIAWVHPEDLFKFKLLPADQKIQDFLLAKR